MPQRVNLHEARLHQYPCLKELEATKLTKEKAHVTWASKFSRAVMLLMLYSLVSDVNIVMPSYNISPTATLTERAACCLHEVNEL
jgi:hypothetical protein